MYHKLPKRGDSLVELEAVHEVPECSSGELQAGSGFESSMFL